MSLLVYPYPYEKFQKGLLRLWRSYHEGPFLTVFCILELLHWH